MSKFVVDSKTLTAVAHNLGDLSNTLNGLPVVTSSYTSDGVIGGDPLERELTAFNTRWHHGVTVVSSEITDMMRRLAAAASAYERIEEKIGSSLHTNPHGSPPKVGGPGHGTGHPTTGGHDKKSKAPNPRRPIGRPPGTGTGTGTTTIGGSGNGNGSGSGSGTGTTTIGGGGGNGGGGGQKSAGHHGRNGSGHGMTTIGPTVTVHSSLLTSDQEKFVGRLASITGLDPRVIGAWVLSEESGPAARSRQAEDNNNWLNIGYFDSGRGQISYDEAWKNPVTAADQTAKFLDGEWGGASSSIRRILDASGNPDAQMKAIYDSNWASSHYEGAPGNPPGTLLHETYRSLAQMKVQNGPGETVFNG